MYQGIAMVHYQKGMIINEKSTVVSKNTPEGIGPYTRVVKADLMLFVSRQLAFDPSSGDSVTDDIKAETRQRCAT
jgi:2-iminobutanoate/2-iminopropanoate deaminase